MCINLECSWLFFPTFAFLHSLLSPLQVAEGPVVGPDALTRIFSASEPFSLLCSQPSPLAGLKNGPSAAIAGCISSPGLGFCALLLGSRAFLTFGGYLIPAFPCLGGGERRDVMALQAQKEVSRNGVLWSCSPVLQWDAAALLREACDTIQTSFTGSI